MQWRTEEDRKEEEVKRRLGHSSVGTRERLSIQSLVLQNNLISKLSHSLN